MPIIGVCGNSGAGKTTVCTAFVSLGARFIDTDGVYHELITPIRGEPSPLVQRIAHEFGDVILADGTLDRRALAKTVFSDREKLKKLNSMTHPVIMEETMRLARGYESDGTSVILIDAPALFECGGDRLCDYLLCVTASEDTRAARVVARDGITKEEAKKRFASQLPEAILRERCDFVIENEDGSDIEGQVGRIMAQLTGGGTDEGNKI